MTFKTILRFEKIKSFQELKLANAHANRYIETPNADIEKTKFNKKLYGANNIVALTKKIFKEKGIKPRKSAVIAMDGLLTVSPEFFKSKQDIIDFANGAKKHLVDNFGDNLLSVHLHLDETSPHIHFYTLPITDDGRLSARDLFNKITLKKHQKEYCQNISKALNVKFEYSEGSQAKHETIKSYYTKANETVKPIQKENEELKKRIKELTKDFHEEEDKNFKLERKVESLEKEIINLKNVISKLKDFISKLKIKLNIFGKEKDSLEKELENKETPKPTLNPFDFPDFKEEVEKEENKNRRRRRLR
ncbi:TPA: MobV family relaxase [Vibrio campbellii]